MKNVLKSIALVLPMIGLSVTAAASTHKASWHCVDAEGKVVEGVKGKKECASPNKWTKAAAMEAPAAEAPAAEKAAEPAAAPAAEAPAK